MFVITLRFADKSRAPLHKQRHNEWLQRGFGEGIFLLAGALQPEAGGAILATGCTRTDLETRVQADPFVAEGIVTADILEITPGRTDERLSFLKH